MIRKCLAATAVLLAMAQSIVQASQILDTANNSGQLSATAQSGGTFIVTATDVQPAGSGVLDSFLRVDQKGSTNTEQGFNTDQSGVLDNVSNAPGTNFVHTLLLSDIPTVTINGIVYREFLLDVNQSGGQDAPVSLNQVQIFQSNGDLGLQTYTTTDPTVTIPSITFTSGSPTQVFTMSGAANSYDVQAKTNSGSGVADMFLYVLNADFSASNGSLVTLYSQFGDPTGLFNTTDGYEEWAVRGASPFTATPEPATLATLLSGLIPLGVIGLLRLRRRAEKVST